MKILMFYGRKILITQACNVGYEIIYRRMQCKKSIRDNFRSTRQQQHKTVQTFKLSRRIGLSPKQRR